VVRWHVPWFARWAVDCASRLVGALRAATLVGGELSVGFWFGRGRVSRPAALEKADIRVVWWHIPWSACWVVDCASGLVGALRAAALFGWGLRCGYWFSVFCRGRVPRPAALEKADIRVVQGHVPWSAGWAVDCAVQSLPLEGGGSRSETEGGGMADGSDL